MGESKSSADFIQTILQQYPVIILLIFPMATTKTILLIFALTASCFAVDCPLNAQRQPKLYSDSVGLSSQSNNGLTNAQNLVYNYQFASPFTTIPSVAIGLNQIQAAQSPNLDIRVSSAKISPSGIYFQAQSGNESLWKNAKINFIASNRNDIELGSTSIASPILNQMDNTFNMIYSLKNDLATNGLKIKSFLQGMNLYSPNKSKVGIKQQNAYISGKQIYFTFGSPVQANIIRSLTISIVVFNVNTPSILYADGTIDQNFVVSTTNVTIPRHGINELRTYIVGINSFETTATQPISITSAIDETFSLVIGPIDRTQIDFVSVSYLILSIVDCGSCEGNPLLFDGLCQPICPSGYNAVQGRCVPTQCQPGQTFDSNHNCVSICGKNQIYSSGTCICTDGLYRINGVCALCPAGSYYDFKSLVCRALCTQNSYYKNGRCYCNPGYYLINQRCQQCTYGTQYDAYTQSCVSVCKENEIYSPSGCVCTNNYNRVNGVCIRCPYQTVYDPSIQQCVCANGLDLVYGQCVPACKKNEVRVDGTCLCASGLSRINGICGVCPPNSSFNTVLQQCVCQPNFISQGGACIPNCTAEQYYSNGKCISYCKQDFQYYSNGQCLCYDDYERLNGVCVPKCLQYQYRVNGTCKCVNGYFKTVWSPVCQPVNCPAGTSFDYTRGDCISTCRANQVYINGQCYCQYGYNANNGYGDCVANCSSYEVLVNGFCQCISGYIRVATGCCVPSNPSTQNCNSIYVFGQCSSPQICASNQYWNGLKCSCYSGYFNVNGQCVPVQNSVTCPPYSTFNGVNCQCNSGYFPTAPGACQRCPSGTYWNGAKCTKGGNNNCYSGNNWDPIRGNCYPQNNCRANEYWDGFSCRCNLGYFYVQGQCSQCQAGTVFDGYRCSPGTNSKNCKDPYSFWNGNACVCLPGYWQLTDGKCITCPQNTAWDGTCCKQKGGQPIPLTTC